MTRGVVAAPHRSASQAGAEVLREGGNAVDAAIAADAVLCVVYPHMTSLAGDLMALVWPAAAGSPTGLIGAGRSGELATIDSVRERGHSTMPLHGPLTVTVPGTVEGWGRLLERFGTWGLAAVIEPAASLASDGFVITPGLARSLKEEAELLNREPAAHALFPPMDAGMVLRNPDLASVLRDLGAHGLNGFYRGEIAAAIVDSIKRRDGLITALDLAGHRSQWVEPVALPYRDLVLHQLPPPTQGLAAAAMAAWLDRVPAPDLASGRVLLEHLVAAADIAHRLRERFITDPDFFAAPLEPFLNPGSTDPGDLDQTGREGGDTVYLSAADELGNVVSMIQSVSHSFGSGIVAEGTGMLLQNRGCYFSLDPRHVNRLEPRKRTMHTLIPAMAERNGRPWAAYGSMGGDGQPQLQTQVLIGLVDMGLEPAEAVARPRMLRSTRGEVLVEANHPQVRELIASRPDLRPAPPGQPGFGHAHALVVDGPAAWRAGADPRSDGSVEFA